MKGDTLYLSNIPYFLTNNDIHRLLCQYGRVVKVTVLKHRHSRQSRGVCFVRFAEASSTAAAAVALDGSQLGGRRIVARTATDNGRDPEFDARKNYPDKSRCYECGEEGHLSYACPRNSLGPREPPPKRRRLRKNKEGTKKEKVDEEEEVEDEWVSLSSAIRMEQEKMDSGSTALAPLSRPRIRKDSYFSDEEQLSD